MSTAKVLPLFLALTLLMTFPQCLVMEVGLPAVANGEVMEDAFLNTWILAWDAHAIATHPLSLFDANTFYPRRNTLAYSDHLLGSLPITAPVFWLSHDPVLTHNTLLMLSFVLSAWGGCLLTFELTRCRAAAVLAGIVYAFCPYRFAVYSLVQALSSHWMPFALVFLHRFLKSGRLGPLAIAFGFTLLQALSCGYYMLFFPTFLILLILGWACFGPQRPTSRQWAWLAAFFVALAASLTPLARPYLKLKKEMGFFRPVEENVALSADVLSYFACSRNSLLHGKLLNWPETPSSPKFPGIAALFLAVLSLSLCRRREPSPAHERAAARPPDDARTWIASYGLCALACFALSLGPTVQCAGSPIGPGPYRLLYRFVPGYDGLRSPDRFCMVFMLAFSVLVGFGLTRALTRFADTRWRRVALFGLFAFVLLESAHIPLRLAEFAVGDRVPQIYRWLAAQPDDMAIVELPLDIHLNDTRYTYFSAYHWKKLVNGRSGFAPPETVAKFLTFLSFPSDACLDALRDLKVTHVLVHASVYPRPLDPLLHLPGVHLVKRFGDDYLFSISAHPAGSPRRPEPSLEPIPRSRWRVTACVAADRTSLMLDGSPQTFWCTQQDQAPGEWLALDLGAEWNLSALRLSFGPQANRMPRRFDLEVSSDGASWAVVTDADVLSRFYSHVYQTALSHPLDAHGDLRFPPIPCRHLRLRLTDPAYSDWAIAEMHAYGIPSD